MEIEEEITSWNTDRPCVKIIYYFNEITAVNLKIYSLWHSNNSGVQKVTVLIWRALSYEMPQDRGQN